MRYCVGIGILVILLIGCGNSDPPPTRITLSGAYTLESMIIRSDTSTIIRKSPDVLGMLAFMKDVCLLTSLASNEGESGTYVATESTITFHPQSMYVTHFLDGSDKPMERKPLPPRRGEPYTQELVVEGNRISLTTTHNDDVVTIIFIQPTDSTK